MYEQQDDSRIARRRHSLPSVDSLSLASLPFWKSSQTQQLLHRRRLVRERNRLWNHAVLSVLAVALQIVAGFLMIVVISMIWASVFMEFPSMGGGSSSSSPYDLLPHRMDALAAWNEMTQSILLSLGYRLMSSSEIKEALNNRFSGVLFRVKKFELIPDNVYDPNRAVPMVLNPLRLDHRDWFHARIAGPVPFIQLIAKPMVAYEEGIFANTTVILKLNGPFTSRVQFSSMVTMRRLNPDASKSYDCVSSLTIFSINTAGIEIPLLPMPTPAEQGLVRFERMISILKDWRWETSGWASRLDDHTPEWAHGDDADAPVLPHFRRPIAIPEQLAMLSADRQRACLDLWTLFFQRLFYTFLMGPDMQERFRILVSRIVKNVGGPFQVRLLDLNLGIPNWRSCPKLVMLAQLPQPYTYRMMLDIDWPLFNIQLALDGSAHSSSVVFTVKSLRARGPVVFGIEHPLARDLSKGAPKHFISFTYERMPEIEFDAFLDADLSQVFGLPVSSLSSSLQNLFNVYLLKPFVSRFAKLFLMGCVVSPMTLYIPWLDDPSDIRFNSNHAQRVFRWIRRLFATMRYHVDDII